MTKPQLEHIIRAAAGNADVRDIVVIGSQSILGSRPDAPVELLVSMEADVFPRDAPDRSIVIDGAVDRRTILECATQRVHEALRREATFGGTRNAPW